MTRPKKVWRTGPAAVLSCEENGFRLVVRPAGAGGVIRYMVLRRPGEPDPSSFIFITGVEPSTIAAMSAAERQADLWHRARQKCMTVGRVEFA